MKIDDVVILDEAGVSLGGRGGTPEEAMSSGQLDLKRQVDQYLEGKLRRLLLDMMPNGEVSLSVDTLLDDRQTRITTDTPLAASTPQDGDHGIGVVTRERQSQKNHAASPGATASAADDLDSVDSELEYKVGSRLEQVLLAPGSIRRITVAVAVLGAPAEVTRAAVEQLVAHAVGVSSERGDSVAVVLLPNGRADQSHSDAERNLNGNTASAGARETGGSVGVPRGEISATGGLVAPAAISMALLLMLLLIWRMNRSSRSPKEVVEPEQKLLDLSAATKQVQEWLSEGASHGHS